MAEKKLSVDLRISKKFKYTPIFKTSFIKEKKKTPKERCSCCKTKVARILGYILLTTVFLLSIAGTVVLWATNTYHAMVTQNLPLKNDSQSLQWWRKPPLRPKIQVYIFNYTNVPEFLSKGEKLKVQELGPYTYYESMEKVNLVWNNKNGTITFQDKRSYEFVPELSQGTEYDQLVVPNMPLLAAVSFVRNEMYLVKLSLATFLHSINAKPFINVNVRELIWGYEDPIFTVARTMLSLKVKIPNTKFGLMSPKVGVSPWRITVGTGELDMRNLGIVTHFNGEDRIDFWKSDECNRIDGTEGTIFPPHIVKKRTMLHFYNRDLCRRFPLVFKEYSQAFNGIPTLRFHPPRDVFAHPSENPENTCFCDPARGVCPPSGVFNISPCAFDTPVMVSFPHFFLGDPTLLDTVEGLQPDPKKHDTYLDLHPELGVPLSGKTSFQINMMVHKVSAIDHLRRFEDRAILPISYVDVVVDELPGEVRFLLFHATYSVRTLQLLMMYGLPVAAMFSALALLGVARRLRQSPEQDSSSPNISTPSATALALGSNDIMVVA